ncbi:hypothetical protein [Arthrobacter sp.]|uniref:hypothetical protein n=1 Tax=Arthrobacter sp. TaxID=1667 RepID=UPI003A8FC7D8
MPIPTTQPRRLALAAATACMLLALTACGGTNSTPEAAASSTTAGTPSSSPAPVEKPGVVATKAIKLFARPDEPERRWFSELRPYLEKEYAVDAEYIDPARIPFDKVLSGPQLETDSHNPQLVLARFKTNDGIWTVEMHQDTPGGEWLVGGIGSAAN